MTEKHYRHLQGADRIKLYELLIVGYAIDEIAQEIGFHRATIYRELQRNSNQNGYRPDLAAQTYLYRRQQKGKKLDNNPALKSVIIEKLKEGWSPELIAGRLKQQAGHCIVSQETIYRYIYSPAGMKLKLYKMLLKKRRFRYPRIKRRRQTIANSRKTPIKERAESINNRINMGHWEGDLVIFKKTKTNLFTLRERKSRLIVAIKNKDRHSDSTAALLVKYMKGNFGNSIKSLTLDNDTAFARHEQIAHELQTDIYFCEPYKSYQKGAIENANRLLRTKLPLPINIDSYQQEDIDMIVKAFNDRPMKCLNYKTPNEVYFGSSA